MARGELPVYSPVGRPDFQWLFEEEDLYHECDYSEVKALRKCP